MAHGQSYWELPLGETAVVAENEETPSNKAITSITSESAMKFIEQQKKNI